MSANDYTRYQTHLASTRDVLGVERRDHALKLFAESLLDDSERLEQFAMAHARSIADGFDKARQPKHNGGQLQLCEDDYLVVGENERVSVKRATAAHARQWWEIQTRAHVKESEAFAAKGSLFYRLLPVMESQGCSMYDAQSIVDGAAA